MKRPVPKHRLKHREVYAVLFKTLGAQLAHWLKAVLSRRTAAELLNAYGLLALILVTTSACDASKPQPNVKQDLQPPAHSDAANKTAAQAVSQIDYRVVAVHPHRPTAFSQGLFIDGDKLYESQGLYGQSSLAVLSFPAGELLQEQPLEPRYFAEGLARFDDELIQLTWKSGDVLRYDLDTLALKRIDTIDGQGWGLTRYGAQLVNSNGSATLFFRNPATLAIERELTVRYAGRALGKLNELETVGPWLAANVYQSTSMVFIDPQSGHVVASADLARLVEREQRLFQDLGQQRAQPDVANGIAWRSERGTLLVTGKRWRAIYELALDNFDIGQMAQQ